MDSPYQNGHTLYSDNTVMVHLNYGTTLLQKKIGPATLPWMVYTRRNWQKA